MPGNSQTANKRTGTLDEIYVCRARGANVYTRYITCQLLNDQQRQHIMVDVLFITSAPQIAIFPCPSAALAPVRII